MVTAGHCAPFDNSIYVNFGYGICGKVYKSSGLALGPRVDAAFIQVDANYYKPSAVTAHGVTLNTKTVVAHSSFESTQGITVITEGAKSGLAYSAVTFDCNVSRIVNKKYGTKQVYFVASGMVTARCSGSAPQPGDSGGVVYSKSGSYMAGCHGGIDTDNQGTFSFFSEAKYIFDDLALSPWY